MILGKRPLMRIFGDVRAFECLNCDYMLLVARPPFQPMLKPATVRSAAEAAE
jgi:hypothetical protein